MTKFASLMHVSGTSVKLSTMLHGSLSMFNSSADVIPCTRVFELEEIV